MNLSLQNYLFLSHCIPLPLSALKIIEETPSHPLHDIKMLNIQEIEIELRNLGNKKRVTIRDIPKKLKKIEELIKNSIFDKISNSIEKWNESGITIIPYFDPKYPIKLRNIKSPPKILFVKGNYDLITKDAISIVGTRNPTKYGKDMTFKIGKRFAELRFVVINGFAKGVDVEAVKGGLEAGGDIIGVLGSGLLNPYPKENITLFSETLKSNRGLFMSEQLPQAYVTKTTLAARNRISSALSSGNVFIEGTLKTGTQWQLKSGKVQGKPIIVLKPKEIVEETEFPRRILESEENIYIIEKIADIDQIAKTILSLKKSRCKKISDFL